MRISEVSLNVKRFYGKKLLKIVVISILGREGEYLIVIFWLIFFLIYLFWIC